MEYFAFQVRLRTFLFTIAVLLAFAAVFVSAVSAQDVETADDNNANQTQDVTPPVIAVLPTMFVEAAGATGSVVNYVLPSVSDDIDSALVAACAPASGSLFPLGTTAVNCSATDSAGNRSEVIAFAITVGDTTPPSLNQPANIQVTAPDQSGASVTFDAPGASDAVSGSIQASCAPGSGAFFPIGTTAVTCTAQDSSGNVSTTSFNVTIDAPTVVDPSPTATPEEPTVDPSPTQEPTATPEPTSQPTPAITPTPAALGLPWPPPPPVNPIYGSGPIDGLSVIWGGLSFPVSQEYGHTLFSLSQATLYAYGTDLGLDGRAHPGLDIGMGRGTYLYSPVNGTVVASGGTGGFGFYGNTLPGVGELRIQTAEGNQVILGHMAAIALHVGDQVTIGQFVGLSGGDNGDHLHLETRQASGGGYVAVDPRNSFLIPALAGYNATENEATPESAVEEPELTGDAAPESESQAPPQADAGISDGNDAMIPTPEVDEARREEDPETDTTPDGSLFLNTLVNPPAAPMEVSKRSATEAILGR